MRLTLLLDLDDTLLSNEMGTFIPAYMQSLTNHMASVAPPERMVPALLTATQQMLRNNQPDCTLKDVFEASFFPALGLPIEPLQKAFDSFYKEIFPSLQPLTHFRAEAIDLVEEAFARGYQVAIATNSLFPLTAVHQRLEWAGLPPRKYPFHLIASYETFHFSKPNPAYFAEILARLGWPEEPVIMVGDDPENDIESAQRAGLVTFRITNNGNPIHPTSYRPSAAGQLADFFPWVDSIDLEAINPDFSQPESMVNTLRATPAALASLVAEIPDSHWTYQPEAGEWNLTEILCHLRDVDHEVNIPRLKTVLQEINPFLVGMDTDSWADERHYIHQDGLVALQHFTQYRLEILHILDNLSNRDWERTARHAIFGPTHLKELVSILAGHDRLHLRQICTTLDRTRKVDKAG